MKAGLRPEPQTSFQVRFRRTVEAYIPQVPPGEQAAALELNAGEPGESLLTGAKVEIFFSTFLPSQSGHLTLSVEKPKTKASNGSPQSWQSNS